MEGTIHTGWRRTLLCLAALLSVGLIGLLDFATGPELSPALFYLLPIVVAAWWLDGEVALGVALTAGAVWLAADLATRPETERFVSLWNGFTRVIVFSFFAIATGRMHATQRRLRALNTQLEDHLAGEKTLARTDPLTGLANRRSFMERLDTVLVEADRRRHAVGLLFLDLDHFKLLNDRYGHEAGDACLRAVGELLRTHVREGDLPARLGGDEFAVLLGPADPEALPHLGERLVDQVRALGERWAGVGLGASVGVIWFPSAPHDRQWALRIADQVMYRAKAEGRGRCIVTVWEAAQLSAS